MAKWRFEKEGKPLLQAGESPKSFKQRVAAWEKRTGREYVPMEFGEEEKILSGKTLIGGWGNQTDYFSNDSLVNEQNIKAAMEKGYVDPNAVSPEWKEPATYARSIERDKEMDRMAESGEKEYDQTSIQYAIDEYNKRQEEEKAQLEAWQEEAGYPGVQGGDADYGQWRGDDDEIDYKRKKAEFRKEMAEKGMAIENERYLKSVSQDGMNRTYTTNYREAVKNAAGWSRFYDEQEGGRPVERSDVFTIDPKTGMPVGVMGRSQRRAWDLQRHFDKYGSGSITSTEESEEQEWGPGGQPKASDQMKAYKPTEIKTNSEVSDVTKNITPKTDDILDEEKPKGISMRS